LSGTVTSAVGITELVGQLLAQEARPTVARDVCGPGRDFRTSSALTPRARDDFCRLEGQYLAQAGANWWVDTANLHLRPPVSDGPMMASPKAGLDSALPPWYPNCHRLMDTPTAAASCPVDHGESQCLVNKPPKPPSTGPRPGEASSTSALSDSPG